jgi:hypothetical protein
MLIHILPEVGGEVLTPALESHVIESGHTLTENLGEASVVIGRVHSDWDQVKDPAVKVILKEASRVDTVPASAVLFNIFTLILIDGRPVTLSDWLRDLPDPLNV